jgi:hypothetical protein
MQTVEGSFFAVFNADTGDYDVGIPKVSVTDLEDGQENVFGDTGGLFCPFRESGFQFPLLAPDAQRKVAKPPAMRSRMISGEKPIYAHAMILDRGGPVWNDTVVCHGRRSCDAAREPRRNPESSAERENPEAGPRDQKNCGEKMNRAMPGER